MKLLCRYLRKLATWYNEVIFLYYYELLSLYYWYDVERTQQILKTSFADKFDISGLGVSSSTKLYSRDFSLSPLFNDIFPYLSKAEEAAQIVPNDNPEAIFFVNGVRG